MARKTVAILLVAIMLAAFAPFALANEPTLDDQARILFEQTRAVFDSGSYTLVMDARILSIPTVRPAITWVVDGERFASFASYPLGGVCWWMIFGARRTVIYTPQAQYHAYPLRRFHARANWITPQHNEASAVHAQLNQIDLDDIAAEMAGRRIVCALPRWAVS